jgi:hypothetical protein
MIKKIAYVNFVYKTNNRKKTKRYLNAVLMDKI